MSLTVVLRETALRGLARVRSDDKEAFTQIRRAIAALADQPHPDGAVTWGGTVSSGYTGDTRAAGGRPANSC